VPAQPLLEGLLVLGFDRLDDRPEDCQSAAAGWSEKSAPMRSDVM
jgi:hypothetical protein